MKEGTKGTAAQIIECHLGSYSGVKRDGRISASEASAIGRFQQRVGLKRTNQADRSTWTALQANGRKSALKEGSRGNDVKRLQRALTAAGYYVPASGRFDAKTTEAVRDYQIALGWRTPSGRLSTAVWNALQQGRVGDAKRVKTWRANQAAAAKKAASSSKGKGAKAVAFAEKQIGDSYRRGGTGPNAWDCSGLTLGSWKAAGVNLPRTSQAQYSKIKKKVSKSQLQPGDLVFYYGGRSHVAIYAGNGKIIHSSRPGKPVSKVSVNLMPFNGAVRPA